MTTLRGCYYNLPLRRFLNIASVEIIMQQLLSIIIIVIIFIIIIIMDCRDVYGKKQTKKTK